MPGSSVHYEQSQLIFVLKRSCLHQCSTNANWVSSVIPGRKIRAGAPLSLLNFVLFIQSQHANLTTCHTNRQDTLGPRGLGSRGGPRINTSIPGLTTWFWWSNSHHVWVWHVLMLFKLNSFVKINTPIWFWVECWSTPFTQIWHIWPKQNHGSKNKVDAVCYVHQFIPVISMFLAHVRCSVNTENEGMKGDMLTQ